MKQIVDKLNKIAKKIDESVEIPQTDLIIDSLDAITKAYGGTPNDSTLIVDKLEDIYNNIEPAASGNIEITENGENINVAPYATATVNVSGGGGDSDIRVCAITFHPLSSSGTVHSGQPNIMVNPETGLLIDTSTISIETDTELLALYVSDGENVVITYNTLEGESEEDVRNAISDMVNMNITVDNDGGIYYAILAPIDPSLNSSCTINVPSN